MSRKITRILALLLALSMTYSIAGCSKIEDFFDLGESSRSERRTQRMHSLFFTLRGMFDHSLSILLGTRKQ